MSLFPFALQTFTDAYHSPVSIRRRRHQPSPNAGERAPRSRRSTQRARAPTRPGATGAPRILSVRPARALGRRCPTHVHTRGNTGLPRHRRGREMRSRGGRRELQSGRVPASGARARAALLRAAPPPPRPPLLPRAGSARPEPRACARVRRPGPSGGGPVDANESVARSRINPFPARSPEARRVPCLRKAAARLPPSPHRACTGRGGAAGGVHGRLDSLCSCRRAATIRDVHDPPPPRPLPKLQKKKKI